MILCLWTYSIWPKVDYETRFWIGFYIGILWLHRQVQNRYVMGVKNDGWKSRQKHHRQQYFVCKWDIEDNPMAIGNKQDNPTIWNAKYAIHSYTLLFDLHTMKHFEAIQKQTTFNIDF